MSPSTAKRIINQFQECIWDDRVQVDQNEILDILRDLAHDLDYFEGDPSLRAEDNAFFDEEKLKAEIESALNAHPGIRESTVITSDGPAGITSLVAYIVPTAAAPTTAASA